MDEVGGLALLSTICGVAAGAVLGWVGSRAVFFFCLGLALAAVAVMGIQASLDHGWGTIQHALFAGLTLMGTVIASVVWLVVRLVRGGQHTATPVQKVMEDDRRT